MRASGRSGVGSTWSAALFVALILPVTCPFMAPDPPSQDPYRSIFRPDQHGPDPGEVGSGPAHLYMLVQPRLVTPGSVPGPHHSAPPAPAQPGTRPRSGRPGRGRRASCPPATA